MRPAEPFSIFCGEEPVGALVIKTLGRRYPDEAMNDAKAVDQVYFILKFLQSYYGVVQPFAYLLPIVLGRHFGYQNLTMAVELNRVIPHGAYRTHAVPQVGPMGTLGQSLRGHQKAMNAVHVKRHCFCSKIYLNNDSDILKFLGSVLKKMDAVEILR